MLQHRHCHCVVPGTPPTTYLWVEGRVDPRGSNFIEIKNTPPVGEAFLLEDTGGQGLEPQPMRPERIVLPIKLSPTTCETTLLIVARVAQSGKFAR